ncbi:HD domain-containing protein [Kribbella sp. NPDC003557]|uniref:HD domain-containing protein n=1 Tax=Kribbella sp. NPDC003557 TaxID=3154449 RepID=UPI00339F4ED0
MNNTFDDDPVVAATSEFVRDQLHGEQTGHDWWHAQRVMHLATMIAQEERADLRIVRLAALLHDVKDFKFVGNFDEGPKLARSWLTSNGVDERVITAVEAIVRGVSFKGANVTEVVLSLEGRCVRDADRLDAMGAIGIARTFAYGGHVGRPIHDPDCDPVLHDSLDTYLNSTGTTINHFHEKLLLLKDRLTTSTGRRLGDIRHDRLLRFLADFDEEWQQVGDLASVR